MAEINAGSGGELKGGKSPPARSKESMEEGETG